MGEPQILVVDDSAPMREMLTAMLSRAGFGVIAVGTSAEALRATPPDVALIDLRLGAEDGASLAALLRGRGEWAQVPLVAMSADPGDEDPAYPFDARLTKPIDPARLIATLRGVLAR